MLLSVIIYMYVNPSIDNEDFDLEYKISSGKKNYNEARNKNYDDIDYKFNHLNYCNNIGIRLIIHSLDKKPDGRERVIFIVKNPKEKFPSAIIDYFDTNTNFSLFKIKYVADSIYIWKNISVVQEQEELFFKGEKCK